MNAAELLARAARKIAPVELDGDPAAFHVRSLSVAEMRVLAERSDDGDAETMAATVAAYACDETGSPLLTFEQACELVAAGDSSVARRILEAGNALNSLTKQAVEKARGN